MQFMVVERELLQRLALLGLQLARRAVHSRVTAGTAAESVLSTVTVPVVDPLDDEVCVAQDVTDLIVRSEVLRLERGAHRRHEDHGQGDEHDDDHRAVSVLSHVPPGQSGQQVQTGLATMPVSEQHGPVMPRCRPIGWFRSVSRLPKMIIFARGVTHVHGPSSGSNGSSRSPNGSGGMASGISGPVWPSSDATPVTSSAGSTASTMSATSSCSSRSIGSL